MKTILVRITMDVPVEVPDTKEYRERMYFDIEENGCPGTGKVWNSLKKIMEEHDENNTCWACALNGKNEIIIGFSPPCLIEGNW